VPPERPRDELLAQARQAVDQGDHDRARTLAAIVVAHAADEMAHEVG
jgi:hypothetical protein